MNNQIQVIPPQKLNCPTKYSFDLTVRFGGLFVHSPVAKYEGGGTYLLKGLTGVHAGEQELKYLLGQYGLQGINGFYHLNKGFVLLSNMREFVKLYSGAILKGGGLTLYADLSGGSREDENVVTNEDDELIDVELNKEEKSEEDGIEVSVEFLSEDEENVSKNKGKQVKHHVSATKRSGTKKTKDKGKNKDDEDEFFDPEYDYTTEREEDARLFHDGLDNEDKGEENLVDEVGGSSKRVINDYSSDEEMLGEPDIDVDDINFDTENQNGEGVKKGQEVNLNVFDETDIFSPKFSIGTVFTNKKLLKMAIASHAQVTQRKLKLTASDPNRVHYKCKGMPPCSWKLHVKKLPGDDSFTVNKYYHKHLCNPTSNFKNCNSTWLARKYTSTWACDPKRSVTAMKRETKEKLGINVTRQQLYRARKNALDLLYGTEEEQIGLVWDYKAEVLDKNPGSTIIIDVLPGNIFDKFYVCLAACKDGFKHCRPVVGLDGCHLNGEYGGILLTAVGIDPNNNTYPIAWAIVRNECFDTWSWFLTLLEIDLEMQDHSKWTFMSDKQKGLTKVFVEHFRDASNRFCVKHLHGNMKVAGFTGTAIKEALWNIATSTTQAQYAIRKQELMNLSVKAAEWLDARTSSGYCRAFFSTLPKCDMLLNNGCETFNGTILPAREMGIICMCEWLMNYVMTRFRKNRDMCNDKWKGKLCPRIRQILNTNTDNRVGCFALKSTADIWAVETSYGEKYTVDLGKKTCCCRKWDLSGIPCRHAVICILELEKDPEEYVHEAYHVKTYKQVYQPAIVPINGRKEWNDTGIEKPLPPNAGRSAGRPTHNRKRATDEPANKQKKGRGGRPLAISKVDKYSLKRQQVTCKCHYCEEIGHNSVGCPIRKADEAVECNTEPFSFKKAAEMEEGGPSNVKVAKKAKSSSQPAVPVKVVKKAKVASSKAPPAMWEQVESLGVNPKALSKTIKLNGATVHMQKPTSKVMTRGQLLAFKNQEKNK